jgi:hypothetical protein
MAESDHINLLISQRELLNLTSEIKPMLGFFGGQKSCFPLKRGKGI